MELHSTLKMLMDSLFATHGLQNWSLFEEINKNTVVVRLRFTKSEDNSAPTSNISFRRKSTSQTQRDRDRAARHRTAQSGVSTRSNTASNQRDAATESPELARHTETISPSNTRSLEVSPVVHLNPATQSFDPDSVIQNWVNEDGFTSMTNADVSAESTDTDDTCRHSEDVNISMPNLDSDLDSEKLSCANDTEYQKHQCVDIHKIRCVKCFTTYRGAVNVYKINMMWCDDCEIYECEDCYTGSRHSFNCKKRVRIVKI